MSNDLNLQELFSAKNFDLAKFAKNTAKGFDTLNKSIMIGKGLQSPEARRQIAQWAIKKGVKYVASGGKNLITDAIKYFKK